jgi:hypothetical protein
MDRKLDTNHTLIAGENGGVIFSREKKVRLKGLLYITLLEHGWEEASGFETLEASKELPI